MDFKKCVFVWHFADSNLAIGILEMSLQIAIMHPCCWKLDITNLMPHTFLPWKFAPLYRLKVQICSHLGEVAVFLIKTICISKNGDAPLWILWSQSYCCLLFRRINIGMVGMGVVGGVQDSEWRVRPIQPSFRKCSKY